MVFTLARKAVLRALSRESAGGGVLELLILTRDGWLVFAKPWTRRWLQHKRV